MGVSPSAQDETQFDDLAKDSQFYIRGIVNQLGEAKFDIIFNDMNVKITDLAWEVQQEAMDLDQLIAALTSGVKDDKKITFSEAAMAVRTCAMGLDTTRAAFWKQQVSEKVKGFTTGVTVHYGGYPGRNFANLPDTTPSAPSGRWDEDWYNRYGNWGEG